MAKAKSVYVCTECGATALKWQGQCPHCGAWNTLVETVAERGRRHARRAAPRGERRWSLARGRGAREPARMPTGIGELDRVLGGGLVAGQVVLIGGDPGIGKSTLLLQALAALGAARKVLYVTGEESAEQVALRARRLGLDARRRAAAGRDPARAHPRRRWRPQRPRGRGDRLDPDALVRGAAVGAGLGGAGARVRGAAHALRQEDAAPRCSSSATSPRKARSPGRACSSTSSTRCSTSRATRIPASAWCARSRTASAR